MKKKVTYKKFAAITILLAAAGAMLLLSGCSTTSTEVFKGLSQTVKERAAQAGETIISQDYTFGATWLGSEKRLTFFAGMGQWKKATPIASTPTTLQLAPTPEEQAAALAFVMPTTSGATVPATLPPAATDGKVVRRVRRRETHYGGPLQPRRDTPEVEDVFGILKFLKGYRTAISALVLFIAFLAARYGWIVDKGALMDLLELGAAVISLAGVWWFRYLATAPIRRKATSTTPGGKFNPDAPVRGALKP